MSNLADWTFLDAAYRRGLAPEPQTISLGLGRSGESRLICIILAAPLFLSKARRPRQGRASLVHPSREPLRKHRDDRRRG
jgi:hypothetical protein